MHPRLRIAALSLLTGCAQGGFELPPAPSAQPAYLLVAEPEAAFAGETVRVSLRPSGASALAAPARVARLFADGAPLQAEVLDDSTLSFAMPAASACASRVAVTAAIEGAAAQAATLNHLGPGHPGASGALAFEERPVRFVPRNLRPFTEKSVVASAYGSALLILSSEDLSVASVSHAGDFVERLETATLPGKGTVSEQPLAVYLGHYGGFGRLLGGSGSATPPEELQDEGTPRGGAVFDSLPSLIFDPRSSFDAVGMLATPEDRHVYGFLVGHGETARSFDLGEVGVVLREVSGTALSDAARIAPLSMVSGNGARHLVAAGGRRPAVALVDDAGASLTSLQFDPSATPFPVRAAATSFAPAPADVRRHAFISWAQDPVPGEASTQAPFPQPGGPTGPGVRPGDLTVVQLNDVGDALAEAATLARHAPPFSAVSGISAVGKGGTVAAHAFAADGAEPALFHFRRDTDGALSTEVLPAAAPLVQLASGEAPALGPEGSWTVAADADGRLYRYEATSDGTREAYRSSVPVGLGASLHVEGDGCRPGGVVLASRALDSVILSSPDSAIPAAFTSGAGSAQAAVAVRAVSAGGDTRVFFVSGGDGLTVTESAVQSRALDRVSRTTRIDGLSVRALAPLPARGEVARAVAGTDSGLHLLEIPANFRPGVDRVQPKPMAGSCGRVSRLAVSGEAIFSLGVDGDVFRLCRVEGSEARVIELPDGVRAEGLAVVSELAGGARRVRVFLAGDASGLKGSEGLWIGTLLDSELGASEPVALAFTGRPAALLPQGAAVSSLAASPDGARLFVGLSGAQSGVLVLDPRLFLPGSAATEDERAASMRSLPTSSAPLGMALTPDGAEVYAALQGDALAIIR